MITLTARISLLNSNSGTFNSATINSGKSNISSDFNYIVGHQRQGSKPMIFGASILGNGDTFASSIPYFIGDKPNTNGQFATPYTITINGSNITAITIEFDTYNNQHPNSIAIDGTTYADDDPIFTVGNLTSANSHTITINNWNVDKYPLRIQGIYVDLEIKIDNRNMISLDRTIMDRSDISKPNWGIIANSGNIEFNDLGGEIKDYIEQQLLKSDLSVYLEIKNTLVENKVEQVGKFATDKWTYDNNNKVVSVSLKDDLLQWQEIQVSAMPLRNQMTMKALYDYLVNLSSGWTFEPLDTQTLAMLTNTVCSYPYLENGSLWSQWNKLCEVCGLYIYKNNDNNIVVSYEFGSN